MAIYTNYGRFLKAKMFKDLLCGDNEYETYMLLGIGNPKWDNIGGEDNNQPMPVASFDTKHLNSDDLGIPPADNQFYDANAAMWFLNPVNANPSAIEAEYFVKSGKAVEHSIMDKCNDLIPPFPGLWANYENNNKDTLTYAAGTLKQNDYPYAYVTETAGTYTLNILGHNKDFPETGHMNPYTGIIPIPADEEEAQYFAELYLRGLSLSKGIKTPCGLLGAIKCKIDYVVDIGQDYTGDVEQFWYGDRYWKVVTVDENLNDGINVFPHHLLFTATVNPRNLCSALTIDQYVVPRQLAIYARKKKVTGVIGSGENAKLQYKQGPRYYRIGENVFNFGQYSTAEINDTVHPIPIPSDGELLNFTLPFNTGSSSNVQHPDGEFKFLLNDYIKGSARDPHSVDRLGYIVGF